MHFEPNDGSPTPATCLKGIGGRYHRVSTTRQDTERQVADIDRWLATHSLATEHVWEDHDSRDKAEQRHDFQRMMSVVRSRAVDWVVIQTIDRLGFKDTYELFSFINEFRANGVQLWSALDGICISHADDARVLTNAIAGQTSTKEQIEKANRSQTIRISKALRGEYQGGIPPYGLDVVCYSNGGLEKWRFVMEQANRRVANRKPNGGYSFRTTIKGVKAENGNETPCNGVPAHDKGDVMKLAPTVRADRIETIRRIYTLLDVEATNPNQIAAKFNAEKVSPVVGDLWTDNKIRLLVTNPAYMGRPASNKAGQPRFFEVKSGKLKRVESRGKVKGKRRTRDEWIMPPEPIFEPIVDAALWERVNEKIAVKQRRAPRNEQLYFAGLLYCAKCGERMPGFMIQRRSKKDNSLLGHTPYYQCGTRNKYGPKNPTDCGFHGTRQDKIEPLVVEFLAKRGQLLNNLLSGSRDQQAWNSLADEHTKYWDEYHDLLNRMRDRVEESLAEDKSLPWSLRSFLMLPPFSCPEVSDGHEDVYIVDAYDHLLELTADKITTEIQTLEKEHDRIAKKVLQVSAPKLVEKLNAQAQEVETKIASLKERLEPLRHRWEEMNQELDHLRQRLTEAEDALLRGSSRMKAQALRACIQKIECWYRQSPGGKAVLEKVKITPQIGEPHTVEVSAGAVIPSDDTGRHGSG